MFERIAMLEVRTTNLEKVYGQAIVQLENLNTSVLAIKDSVMKFVNRALWGGLILALTICSYLAIFWLKANGIDL